MVSEFWGAYPWGLCLEKADNLSFSLLAVVGAPGLESQKPETHAMS